MITVGFIITLAFSAAFLSAIVFGKQPEQDEIVWRKLDDHERKLAE